MRYAFGDYVLDVERRELWCQGQPVPLRPKVFDLLVYLIGQRDRMVSREELQHQLWPALHVSPATLSACVKLARRAVGDRGTTQECIQTRHGRGYRFVAAVEVQPEHPEGAPPPPEARAGLPAATPPSPAEAAVAEEYKQVTVLCGALADAPALAARLGPEAWYRHVQPVLDRAQAVLRRYVATLTLTTPDGFTAVFGAPVAQEDHARRAVLAALALRQGLQDLTPGHPLTLGLHSGLVVVGPLGAEGPADTRAVGAPLHIATRLQQQAAPGTILLSAATYQLVHAEVQATPAGTLALTGQPTPVPLYTLDGLVRRQAGVVGRSRQTPSPFVGRTRELALLHDHLALARAGQGRVVGIVGEPGLGKSRLVTEFCCSLHDQPVTIYTGRCLADGQTTPYLPVRDLLRQLCGLHGGEADSGPAAAMQRHLHGRGVTAESDVALLGQILDLPTASTALERLSSEARQARTFALLRHLLLEAARAQPLVLVLEDLHWSDPTSAAWLASLVARLPDTAVLLLGTARPGSPPAWGAHAAVAQIALAPLAADESRAVARAVLGPVPLAEARLQTLVARAGGNPFFLEELAWDARDQGGADAPDAVPATVQAVLAARLDRLPPEAKALVQVAAVLGPTVPVPLLQAATGLPDAAIQEWLATLQGAAFLVETAVLPETVYAFTHALTQEVAYGSLLLERRRVLHARLVEILEARAGDRQATPVAELAYHALRGELWAKAVAYCRQAGEQALARWAHREAAGYFEQALGALAHLPDQRATREQAVDLRLVLRLALLPAGGNFARMLGYLREAEAIAEALDDPPRRARVALALSLCFSSTGVHDQAIALSQHALVLAHARGDGALRAQAAYRLGIAYHDLNDVRRAVVYLQRAVAPLDRARADFGQRLPPRTAVNALANLALDHAELGDFAAGRPVGEAGLWIAEAIEDPEALMFAHWGLGRGFISHGDADRGLPLLERAYRLCHDAALLAFTSMTAGAVGKAYTLSGRAAEAVSLLTYALDQTRVNGRILSQTLIHRFLGEALLQAGHREEARAHAEQALALARARRQRASPAYALWLLGDIAAHRDPPDGAAAAAFYQEALALAEALGMRPLQAHCQRGLGTLYATLGRRPQAREALGTARALYQAMDMAFWLSQTEATLAQVEDA